MRVYLAVEVEYEDATIKDREELLRSVNTVLGEFCAGDGDNLIIRDEVIEHLEYGASIVPDPCENDGVLNKIIEILEKGEQSNDYNMAAMGRLALKFCRDYKR